MSIALKKLLCNYFLTTGNLKIPSDYPFYAHCRELARELDCSTKDVIANAIGLLPTKDLSEYDVASLLSNSQQALLNKYSKQVGKDSIDYLLKQRNNIDRSLARLNKRTTVPLMIIEYWRVNEQQFLYNDKHVPIVDVLRNFSPAYVEEPNVFNSLKAYLPDIVYDEKLDYELIYGGTLYSPNRELNKKDLLVKIVSYLNGVSTDITISNISDLKDIHDEGKLLNICPISYSGDLKGASIFELFKSLILSGEIKNINQYLSIYDYNLPNFSDNYSPTHKSVFYMDLAKESPMWCQLDRELNEVVTCKMNKDLFKKLWCGEVGISKGKKTVAVNGVMTTLDEVPLYKDTPLIDIMTPPFQYKTDKALDLSNNNVGSLYDIQTYN